MPAIRKLSTVTAEGQITLPKPIRQALGLDFGDKVAFDLHDSKVMVTRAESPEHEDPAIGHFLALLETDIRNGRHLSSLPDDLLESMLATLSKPVDLEANIDADVTL
jgi:antitoxin PrlF